MLRSVSSRSAGPSLLSEGETCWRSAIATRATLLIDGDEYFRALRSALLQARHQVLIAGWDFDTRTSLPGEAANDDAPTELGELLGYLIRRRPDLQVHVLRWDYHWLYADDRERDNGWACTSTQMRVIRSPAAYITRSSSSTMRSHSVAAWI